MTNSPRVFDLAGTLAAIRARPFPFQSLYGLTADAAGQIVAVYVSVDDHGHGGGRITHMHVLDSELVGLVPDGLQRERDNLQARLTAMAKSMLKLRDDLAEAHDDLEDDGDRVYFGSTNDADAFRTAWKDLDEWAWDDIMADGKLDDIYEVSRNAHARAEAAEAMLTKLRGALTEWRKGCSNGPAEKCLECSNGALLAIERLFEEAPDRRVGGQIEDVEAEEAETK